MLRSIIFISEEYNNIHFSVRIIANFVVSHYSLILINLIEIVYNIRIIIKVIMPNYSIS